MILAHSLVLRCLLVRLLRDNSLQHGCLCNHQQKVAHMLYMSPSASQSQTLLQDVKRPAFKGQLGSAVRL